MASEIFVAGSSAPDGVARSGGTGRSTGEMTMTPDDLRALADVLSNGTHFVESPELHEAMLRAADYLRQCADAVPVAWLYRDAPWFDGVHWHDQDDCTIDVRVAKFKDKSARPLYTHPAPVAPHHAMLDSHRRLVEQAIQSAEHPPGMSTHDGKAHIDASILRRMLAIIDSLSAVPAGWKWVPVEPTPEMLSAVGMMDGYDWHAPGCSPDADHANWYSAMIAAAPAAPQEKANGNR